MIGHTHQGEIEAFQAAIHEHVEPLADKYGLSFTEIDPELFALTAPGFYIKFYCAGGHGYSFTVTIGSSFLPEWNTGDERGLAWLVRYVGKDDWRWTYERYGTTQSYAEGIAHVAALLPSYIHLLKSAGSSFWPEFYEFVRVNMVLGNK